MNVDRVSYVRRRLAESQLSEFPKYTKCLGLDIEVHKDVFWDDDNNVTGRWVTENIPPMTGKRVLEIGCGSGLTALYLAKNGASHVLATDLNPNAVANTLANAQRNGISNVTSIKSDLYNGIDRKPAFDYVVFHLPATRVDEGFQFSSMIEYSSFDPGGSVLNRFLGESADYLEQDGAIILAYNVSRSENVIVDKLAERRFKHKLIASKRVTPDGVINLHLYEIWPRPS